MLGLKPASPTPPCYFTLAPSNNSDHYSTETPLASPELNFESVHSDPYNPLLALRSPSTFLRPSRSMDASKLMSLQTAAAHQYSRPKPQPAQNALGGSDDSVCSAGSSVSEPSAMARGYVCSRCQRQGYTGFVCYSVNSYYCQRCAAIVGYGHG